MAEIDELNFGSILVEGKKYRREVLILVNATVKEAESWAKWKNLRLLVRPSYNAVARLNELAKQKKLAPLIHITC